MDKERDFIITDEQIEKLRPYLKNIDELLFDHDKFEDELDSAILYETDRNFDPTPTSLMLERIYDDIYWQNKDL